MLDEALALWRGPPLDDFTFESFAQADIARLTELRLAAVQDRLTADLALGRHAELVGEIEGMVKEHPLRERLRAQLMLALYRSGRQAEALEAYQSARAALVEELGIEPGRELRDLHEAILQQDPGIALAARDQATDEPERGIFVGRDAELAELVSGLDDACAGRGRLFLLVGEPGIGKSRLAEELISHARGAWRSRPRRALLGSRRRSGLLAVGAGFARPHPRRGPPGAARPVGRRGCRDRTDPARAGRAVRRPPRARAESTPMLPGFACSTRRCRS